MVRLFVMLWLRGSFFGSLEIVGSLGLDKAGVFQCTFYHEVLFGIKILSAAFIRELLVIDG